MRYIFSISVLFLFTPALTLNIQNTITEAADFFENYKILLKNSDLLGLHQLIDQIETLIKKKNLTNTHELSHFLEHLYEHKNNFFSLNTKAAVTCTIPTCPFLTSYTARLTAGCITSNNITVNNKTTVNGVLCPRGPVIGGVRTKIPFFYAYDTTQQIPTDTFQNIFFSNVGPSDGTWSYDPFTGDFNASSGGWFLITYNLFYKNAPASTPPFIGTISAHLLGGPFEVSGSQASIRVDTTDATTSFESGNYIGRSIVAYLLPGRPLTLQHTTSTNVTGNPAAYLEPDGIGDIITSASISIIQLKQDNPS